MLDISWGEVLVLIVAGLFILGPERLPGAARWLGKTVRQVREYATGARDQLQSELGPEFEEFRKPLAGPEQTAQLRPEARSSPSTCSTRPAATTRATTSGSTGRTAATDPTVVKPNGYTGVTSEPAVQPQQRPLSPGERPPFDPDAT